MHNTKTRKRRPTAEELKATMAFYRLPETEHYECRDGRCVLDITRPRRQPTITITQTVIEYE